ncbi:hypothetical protein UlMin_007227 [Ulmus minor]
MHEEDQEHTAFLTNQGLYCYKVMSFGLKNAGATYQRLVNKMFKNHIGKTMEVYVDDLLAGIILVSPDGVKLSCAVRFKFKATNNQAEYEALLSGLRLAKEVSARHLTIYSDSQLVVSQVNSEFQAKGEKMASYLEKEKEAMNQFDR